MGIAADSQKKGATHQGYYWVIYDNQNQSVLFTYHPGRGRAAPQTLLKGYQGYLQSDGYAVYEDFERVPGIVLVGCLAHARRKFYEAQASDAVHATQALAWFQSIYAVERQIKEAGLTGAAKLQYRQAHAQPLLVACKAWMLETYPKVLLKSAMGKSVRFFQDETVRMQSRCKSIVC